DAVEVMAGAGKGWYRGHRNVIAEKQRCGAGPSAPAVENDVIGPGGDGKVDVALDVLGTQLEADGNSASDFPNPIGEPLEILDGVEVGKGGRRYRGLALGNAADFG